MNSRVARAKRMFVLWRWVAAMPMLVALSGAAYAQAGDAQMLKEKDQAEGKEIKQYIDRMQNDENYEKTIHEQPSAPKSNDPWGSVRAATTPASSAAKPAAKPATKTASGSGKPAAIKPGAVKPAPSTNSATQKSQ